mgnify:CR=1 FL=1
MSILTLAEKLEVKPIGKGLLEIKFPTGKVIRVRKRFGGRNWIQRAIKHRGALHRQLKIPPRKKIPVKLLKAIVRAKAGQTIRNPTKVGKRRIKVTRLLERRAILALTLRKLRK